MDASGPTMTGDEAIEEAIRWAEGRGSWVNYMDPNTLGLHFIADALQTQAWAAIAQALYARETSSASLKDHE